MNLYNKIEYMLNTYKQVYLIDISPDKCCFLLKMIEETYKKNVPCDNKVLLVLDEKYNNFKYNFFNIDYWNENELKTAIQLYYKYEFSDKIQILTDKREFPAYADIFNYVDTGLLTMDEAAEALLF